MTNVPSRTSLFLYSTWQKVFTFQPLSSFLNQLKMRASKNKLNVFVLNQPTRGDRLGVLGSGRLQVTCASTSTAIGILFTFDNLNSRRTQEIVKLRKFVKQTSDSFREEVLFFLYCFRRFFLNHFCGMLKRLPFVMCTVIVLVPVQLSC